jgi:hypothetical protein
VLTLEQYLDTFLPDVTELHELRASLEEALQSSEGDGETRYWRFTLELTRK